MESTNRTASAVGESLAYFGLAAVAVLAAVSNGIPHNPLDAIVTRFGVDNVAEISGRTHRWEKGQYDAKAAHNTGPSSLR